MAVEGQKHVIVAWPRKGSYPRTCLHADPAASSLPVLLQQMLTRSVSGTEELPRSTASPARPTEENHEMMTNTQFSLNIITLRQMGLGAGTMPCLSAVRQQVG